MNRIKPLFVVFMATLLILTACATPATPTVVDQPAPTQAPEETTLEHARREGIIRVGFANESPFAFSDPGGQTDRRIGRMLPERFPEI